MSKAKGKGMREDLMALRRAAVEQAKANSSLSGFIPSEFALSLYEQWIAGSWNVDEGVVLFKQYHQELEAKADLSDGRAPPNLLGITDSARMKQAEADIMTLRMAELNIYGV
jgi:hypothetical protein